MLLFCAAVYIVLVIPALLILWAALNAARNSDQIDEEQKA